MNCTKSSRLVIASIECYETGGIWRDIWVMNADGSHQHPITHDATDYGTAWSPDGRRIATLDFPSRTIYTLNARDGSDRVAVHPSGLQFVPGWQPRGTEGSQGEDQNAHEGRPHGRPSSAELPVR